MNKGLKIAFKVLGWTLVTVFLLLLAAMIAVQSPRVQSFVGQRVIKMLQNSMDADVSFSEVSFKPFETLILKDVLITDPAAVDHRADTVARLQFLSAKFSIRGLFYKEGVHVNRLTAQGITFNLVIEPGSQPGHSSTNIQRIFRIQDNPDAEPKDLGNLFDARVVDARDLHFRLLNPVSEAQMAENGSSYAPGTIDWNNLDAWVSSLIARNIRYSHNVITGTVDNLRLGENATGFVLEKASGKVKVGNAKVQISDLELLEQDTHILAKYFNLEGPIDDYADFINKIKIDAEIEKGSIVSMLTVSHFGPLPEGTCFRGYLQGRASGTVSDFNLQDLVVQDPDSGINVQVRGGMKGLPEIMDSTLDFKIDQLDFDMPGVARFVNSWAPGTGLDLSGLAKGQRFVFDGTVRGLVNSLNVKGTAAAADGDAQIDLVLQNAVDTRKDIGLDGRLKTRDLDLGRILSIEALGPVSLESRLSATLASSGPQLQIDTLQIARLRALDYNYSNISASGYYRNGTFDGRIVSADPNLSFLFQGTGKPSGPSASNYGFLLSMGYADLQALNLDQRGRSRVSFQADSNFSLTDSKELQASLQIRGLNLENNSGVHDIGDITLSALSRPYQNRIDLKSNFLDGSFSGGEAIQAFINDLKYLVLDKELPSLLGTPSGHLWDGTAYDLSLTVRDARELLDFVMPGLYIENNTRLRLSLEKDGTLSGHFTSGRLAYLDKYLRDVNLTLDNAGQALQADLVSPSLYLSGLELKGNRVILYANDDHLGLSYSFDNEQEAETRAELILGADLSREDGALAVNAQVLPSNIYYEGDGWGISSDQILFKEGNWNISRLFASHEDEALLVDGGFSADRPDTLTVRMEKFNMALLNTLTGGVPQVQGRATGNALVISPSSPAVGLIAGITCDSTLVSGKRLGQLNLESVWNEQENRFDFTVGNRLDGKKTIGLNGFLKPSTAEIDALATLNGLDLGYVAPILEAAFSEFNGGLSGRIRARGPLKDLHLSSENLYLDDGYLALDFCKVPYHASGKLDLDDKGLHFKDVRLTDDYDGTGTIRGSVLLDGFSNFGLDVHVRLNRMKVLELKRGQNSLLYGDLYASGTADVTGWSPNLNLDLNASTVKEGNLHLLLGSSSSSRSSQLLTFTEAEEELILDPYEQMMVSSNKATRQTGNTNIRLTVRPTQDVMVYLDLSEENSLKASGTGVIELESQSATSSLTLNGNYQLNQGSFHFSALNLVSRDFTIQEGSSVHFNGDMWDTDLNVNGLYTTKASLANLIADENAVTRRTVNCGISITDKLRNPQIQFSIDIPDLNPTIQAQVDAALNTDDKVQKQFLYLLLAGGFLPSEESGITTNGSEMLFSNVTGIMAGQINNIFQKLNIPLDLGLNYQATNTGTNIFDVALSTQLFNNRVIVNGSVGNKHLYGTTTSEVAGDIEIEIKLNKSGSLRASLFSHSADQFTSFLDNSQRNGAGITYQMEFNTFRQLFQGLFRPRRTPPEGITPPDGMPREGAPREGISRDGMPPRDGIPASRQVVLQIDSTGHAIPKNEVR